MTRAAWIVLLALICAFSPLPVQAGGGPENTLVVVNPTAEGSMEIANCFQQLRGIPEKNMFYLPASNVVWHNADNGFATMWNLNGEFYISSDTFRSNILVNVMNYIKQQGLTNQIDYIVYSSDFPPAISPSADDPGCQWSPSLTTATIFADYVQTAGTMNIAANSYVNRFRGYTFDNSWPSFGGYTGPTATTNLNHKTSWGGQNYYISAILGWTGASGNTVGEITNMLVRSAQADGSFPSGSVYMDVNSDVRSTTRQPEFVPAQTELQGLGRSAIITTNDIALVNRTNVVGGVLGTFDLYIPDGSTFAKGSIVDHLTSNAATWPLFAQTPCTKWIGVGASGTSGEVEEPYAYASKFPTARMHAHYARGCTMGEAQSQSIWWPTDGLIYGDPLCRPFAIIPSVSLSGLTEGQTVSGTNVTLTPSATTTSPSGIAGYDLYLDGVLWQSVAFGSNTNLDTTKISDGSHELRVVAYENSVIRTQGNLVVDFQVNNVGQAITVTPSNLTTPWNNGTFSLTVAAVGGSPASINILKGTKVVGTISGSSGTAVMNQSDVGVGSSILRASAAMSSGTVQSVKAPVLLQPAADLRAPAVISWTNGWTWTSLPTAGFYLGQNPWFEWQFNKPMGTVTNVQVLVKEKYGYENPANDAPSFSTNYYQSCGLASNTWYKAVGPGGEVVNVEGILSGNVPVIINAADENGSSSYTNYFTLDLEPPQFSAISLSTNFVKAGQTATISFTSSKALMSTNTVSLPLTVTNLVAVGTNLATFVSSNGLNYVYNFTPSASVPAGSNVVTIAAEDLFGNATDTAITSDNFENKPVGALVSSNDSRWVYTWQMQPYVTNDVAATGSLKSAFFPAASFQAQNSSWSTVITELAMSNRQPTGWAEFDIYPDNAPLNTALPNRGFIVAGIGGPGGMSGYRGPGHSYDANADHEVGLVFAQDAAATSNGTYNLVVDLPAVEVFVNTGYGILYGMTNGVAAVPYSSSEAGLVTLATGITTKAWHHVRFGNDLQNHTYTVELDGTVLANQAPYNPLTNGEYEAKSYYYNGGVGTNGIYNINSISEYLFAAVGDNFHVDNVKISGGYTNSVGGYPSLSIFVGNPPVANSQSVSTFENSALAITLTTNATDPVTYSVGSPSHGTLSGTAPNLTYTPNANYIGADSFTFTATDTLDGLTSNVATVSITVNAPVANSQSVTVGENIAKAITLTASGGSAPLTYNVVANPTHGTLSGTAPNLTYTPTAGYTGADSFTFNVTDTSDGVQKSNTATVSITVEAPPVANNGSLTVDANTSWDQMTLSASGGSGSYTYSVSSAAHGTIYNFSNSTVWYTPTSGYTGSDSFTFTATDTLDGLTSNTATVSITVNADPSANNQSVTAAKNTAKAVTLTATGGTGSLTYTVKTNPTNGTLSGTAPNLTYTPNTGYTGSDSFTFNATDGVGVISNTATVSITVGGAPVANNQSVTTDQNTAKAVTLTATGGSGPLTYSVVANPTNGTLSGTAPNLTYTSNTGYTGADSFTFNATDGVQTSNTATVSITVNTLPVANNQSATTDQNTAKAVTLTATGGSGPLTYSVVANPTHGTLSGTAPNLTYTPASGYTGSDSWTFNATDGIATSNTATVSLTVNAAPVANNQSATTDQNIAKAVTLTASGGSGPLTYSVAANPTHGTLSGTAPNLTYTPNTGYTGADSFTFNATDGIATSNTATVSLTVNTLPTANNQSATTDQNIAKAVTLTATGGSGSLTYSVAANPTHGTLSGTAPNLTYTPASGYTGADSFTFNATDGIATSNTATVSLTVNASPVANNQSATTDQNTAKAVTLAATGGSGSLTYSVAANPTHGTLSGTAPNLTYTPTAGYTGADSWTFNATDGIATSNTATVSLTVNTLPVANNQSVTTAKNTAAAITLTATGGSGPLTYSVAANPTHGTLSGTAPNLTYTPNTGYTGSDSFTFNATDGIATSNTATVSLTVNTSPVANNQSATTDQNTAKAVTLTATGGSGPLTYSVVANPTHGTLSGTAPNLTYTPNTGYTGSDSFTFNATDGISTSNTATVSLTVNASPTANNQSATTDQNTAKAVTLTATGGSGPLTYSVVANPTHGTLSGTAPNLTYTPASGYTGSDSFTFNATDGIVTSNTATVSLTVNALPVANNQSVTLNENTAQAVTLTGSGGTGSLTYSVAASPTHGTLSGTAPNLTYTPASKYHGSDSFTFNTTDGIATSNTATVSLTVTKVELAPVAQSQSVNVTENTATTVTLTASDADGDPVTYSVVTSPSHGLLSGTTPNLTYTPVGSYLGSDSFTFKANDGVLDSNAATVTLTVSAAPVTSAASSSSSGSSGTNSVASASPSYVYGTSPASYSSGPAAVADGVTSHESRVASSESQALGSNGNETPGNQSPIFNPPSSILNPPIPSSQGYFGAPVNPVSFPIPMPVPPPTVGHHESEPTLIRRSTFDVRHPMQKERTEPSSSDVEHRTPASPRLGEGGSNIEHRTSNVERGGAALPVQVGLAALFALGSLAATLVSYGRKIGNFFKAWKK